MKQTFIIICLAAAILFASGTSGGMGAFGPALGLIDFTEINAALTRAGMEKLSSSHWMFGGGGYAIANRTIIGGAGWGGRQSIYSEPLNLVCRVNYGGGEFRTGYVLLDLKHLLIAPMLGIGSGGYTIKLEPFNRPVNNLDSLLRNPGRTAVLSLSGFSLNPHLAVIIPISFIGMELRGGYLLGPFTSGWEVEGGGVLNEPKMKKGTPWFSINVIIGGFSREKIRTRNEIKIESNEGEQQDNEENEEKQKQDE